MSQINLSVLLCTHNPRRDYLERALQGLKDQLLDFSQWELVIIDNLSNPPVSHHIDVNWHPHARILLEPNLGLTQARLRGISDSRGEILVFVDDDNVLDSDYLSEVLRVDKHYPWLGAWSGQCRPGFESPPPEWVLRYLGNLAIREFNNDIWSNLPRLPETMPCGAGLVVRRDVACFYSMELASNQRHIQLDRAGDSLLSGGDNDLAGCSCKLGLGVGLISSLKLTHLIPPQRLTPSYQAKLAEGIHFSSVLLDSYYGVLPVSRSWIGRLIDFLRLLRLAQPHRQIFSAALRGRNRATRMLSKS